MLISFCLPARNEEHALPRLLAALLAAVADPAWDRAWQCEFLLADSASNDGTAAVFRATLAQADPPVPVARVLTLAQAGKARAWNALAAAARGDIMVFCDADITLPPSTPAALIRELLAEPALAAAAGVLLAPPDAIAGLLYRRLAIKMKEFAAKPVPFLNGPLYALRRGVVTILPEEVLHEDACLNMLLGGERIHTVSGALGWQRPPATLGEYYRRQVRVYAAGRQLAAADPAAYARFRHSTADPRSRALRQAGLTAAERRFKVVTFWLGWLQHALDRRARREAEKIACQADWGSCAWATAPSSKAGAPVGEP